MRLPAPLALALLLLVPPTAAAQVPDPPAPPITPQTQTVALDYVFSGAAGILFFHIRPSMGREFEAVARRVSDALASSDDPIRRRQADGWKVFRSEEQHENQIYVLLFDPVVDGADYDLVKILTESLPDEVQGLYAQLQASIVRIERMGLERVR